MPADSINELEAGIDLVTELQNIMDQDRCSRAADYWLVLNFFPVVKDTCAKHIEAGWDRVFRSLQVAGTGKEYFELFLIQFEELIHWRKSYGCCKLSNSRVPYTQC